MAIPAITAKNRTHKIGSTGQVTTTPITNTKVGEKKLTDEFGLQKVAKPAGLKQETYEIKSGDNLTKIAKHFGINRGDLLAQLKDKGPEKGLAADYNPDARNTHDPKCLGEGKTITVSLPKNEAQKDDYTKWMKYERAHYDQCIKTGSKSLASNETAAPSFRLMA